MSNPPVDSMSHGSGVNMKLEPCNEDSLETASVPSVKVKPDAKDDDFSEGLLRRIPLLKRMPLFRTAMVRRRTRGRLGGVQHTGQAQLD